MAESGREIVVGLEEFQRELRALDKKLETDYARIAGKKAAEIVADDARSGYQGLPGVGPRVAPTVRALGEVRAAAVKIGGAGAPFALGVEFGGGAHGRGNPTSRGGYTTQFASHRGTRGYALYPAIRKNRERILDIYGHVLDDLARKAFPD